MASFNKTGNILDNILDNPAYTSCQDTNVTCEFGMEHDNQVRGRRSEREIEREREREIYIYIHREREREKCAALTIFFLWSYIVEQINIHRMLDTSLFRKEIFRDKDIHTIY